MNIGIIGLGSIGKRHILCLQKLGFTNIFALRTKKGARKELPKDLQYVKEFFDEEDFYSLRLDGVIISNPTSLHVETMINPLEKKIPAFIEKPVAASFESLERLKNYDFSNVMVGYCLRYNELINVVKEFIDSGKLGKILKANLYCGNFLRSWHPYADYRMEYYSRKDLGGGVLRTLSHEIDLARYFFAEIKEICASIEKISNLEIDVDDCVHLLCKITDDSVVHIELDYLNPVFQRRGLIIGVEGKLEYSFSNLTVSYTGFDGNTEIIYENRDLDPNKMYLDQMQGFINFIKNQKPVRCTFNDGIYVMKVIKAAEDSSQSKSWQKIE
ncbi:MAG: Gfo/Idh/MocA family protein [Candidatus Hodarchaeales archaeon]|jgi:predicted dehydrogenase